MSTSYTYSRQFKLDLVKRIVVGGEGVAAVARSVDLDEKTVARWRREYARDPRNAFPRSSRLGR
jgi:transposase-like protein